MSVQRSRSWIVLVPVAAALSVVAGCGTDDGQSAGTRTVTVTASLPISIPAPSTAAATSPPAESGSASSASSSAPSGTAQSSPQDEGQWETTPPATHGPGSMDAGQEKALLAAGKRWVELWARPTMGEEQWRSALNPLMTPRGRALVRWTDPANVPALRITGAPQRSAVGPDRSTSSVMVPTSSGNFVIAATRSGDRWLVDGFTVPEGVR